MGYYAIRRLRRWLSFSVWKWVFRLNQLFLIVVLSTIGLLFDQVKMGIALNELVAVLSTIGQLFDRYF